MKRLVMFMLLGNLGYFICMAYFYHPPFDYPAKVSTLNAPASGAKIKLLQEVITSSQQPASLSKMLNPPIWQGAEKLPDCQSFGPFEDVFRAQFFLDQLAPRNILAELKAADRATGENHYWLLIPPAVSQEAAFRKFRELKLQNIEGYIITDGPQTLGISLGLLATRQAALEQQQAIMALGYSPSIVAMPILNRQFWIFVKGNKPLLLRQKLSAAFLRSFPEVKASIERCMA